MYVLPRPACPAAARRASSMVRPTRKERRLDDRGRSEKGIGPRDHRAAPGPLLPFLPHVPSKANEGGVTIQGRGIIRRVVCSDSELGLGSQG